MSKIIRPMKKGDDGLPVVGSNSKELGVRFPPNPNPDVTLDADQRVLLDGRGMSVADDWRHLPHHLIPKRLRSVAPRATGSDDLACYRLGMGHFVEGAINDRLSLAKKQGNPHGGNIVPSGSVHIREFQIDLAATWAEWIIDES